jgi:hypothetical protein
MAYVNWLYTPVTSNGTWVDNSNRTWIDDSTYTEPAGRDQGESTAVPYQQGYWGTDDHISITDPTSSPWVGMPAAPPPKRPFPKLEMWPESLRSKK